MNTNADALSRIHVTTRAKSRKTQENPEIQKNSENPETQENSEKHET